MKKYQLYDGNELLLTLEIKKEEQKLHPVIILQTENKIVDLKEVKELLRYEDYCEINKSIRNHRNKFSGAEVNWIL